MTESLFSNQWYRIQALQPRLRAQVVVNRHHYRGAIWYIVSSRMHQQQLRVNAAGYFVLSQMDGTRDVNQLWEGALASLHDDAPTQNEILNLLSELSDAGFVDFDRDSDVDQIFDNELKKQASQTKARFLNPLFIRFPVFDPDRLVARMASTTGWLFTRGMFAAWMALLAVALTACAFSWDELRAELNQDLVSPANLFVLWFVFPIMKLLHELGHALAVRRWGGEVHEFGIALLILLPVPYVDASASAVFANKHRRMAVAAAGIAVETILASLATLIWLVVEPGMVRTVAFNVMLTGFASSLLFNGNPLLKFDAYYVLSDAIEIPSLAKRASAYLLYLVKRYLLGVQAHSPVVATGERRWFIGYGLAAFVYRISLSLGICLLVAERYFFFGVLLAIWAMGMQLIWPVVKGLRFVLTDASVAEVRTRAVATVGLLGICLALGLGWAQIPHGTHARGVVWPVDDAMVRTSTDCLVDAVLVDNDEWVESRHPLVACDNTIVEAELADLRAQEMSARAAVYATRDRTERGMKESELRTASRLLEEAMAERDRSALVSKVTGRVHIPGNSNLEGSYFKKGELLGYLLSPDNLSVRLLLSQEHIDLIGEDVQHAELRSIRDVSTAYRSEVLQRYPAGSDRAVSAALTHAGGGEFASRRDDAEGTLLAEPAFELELALPADLADSLVGDVVMVRFDHGSASIAELMARQVRLLLLRRFDV